MALKHLRRHIRFFMFCYSGPQKQFLWSLKQTLAYRQNIKRLKKEHRLGHHQLFDLLARKFFRKFFTQGKGKQVEVHELRVADPEKIRIKRINIHRHVEKQFLVYRYQQGLGRLHDFSSRLLFLLRRSSVKESAEWLGT